MSNIRLQRFTVNQAIRELREMSGLSQHELHRLSVELYDAGQLDRSFTQSALSRWERDPRDGADRRMRIEKIQDDSIEALSALFEHALQRAGFDGAKAEDLAKHLHTANRRQIDPKNISDFALHVDMLLSPLSPILREIAEDTILNILRGINAVQERTIAKHKAKRSITDSAHD